MLRICIIGPEATGKSALFRLLSCEEPKDAMLSESFTPPVATVNFKDDRLQVLHGLLPGRKLVNAQYALYDFPGFGKGTPAKLVSRIMPEIKQADLLIAVVKAGTGAEALKAWHFFYQELVVNDYSCSEGALSNLRAKLKAVKHAEEDPRYKLLARVVAMLDAGEGLYARLGAEERAELADLALVTAKPVLLIVNTGDKIVDEGLAQDFAHGLDGAEGVVKWHALPVNLAAELYAMPEAEQGEFKELYGITEPSLPPAEGALLPALGHITFYTYNEKELRAWTVPAGSTAVQAAASIHTDIAHGFIRAEVVNAADLIALGSLAQLKPSGKLRLEGKDYLVRDGDIILVRFSS